jgi:4-amino-4-deoxy-L-arabinose transferase-like glycosyltransferase
MKRNHLLIFAAILLVAAFFRFYKLATIPSGFVNDTAAIGYNAYSILKTGKDEFGKTMPFFFESFGEGKLPLYVYQAVPWVAIFGLNHFSARFSSAFFSLLTVGLVYFLVLLLFQKQKYKQKLAFISMAMLALMPWHIHFSRGEYGQESLFWISLGTYLYFVWQKKKENKLLILSLLSFLASMLIYHAARVFIPLWLGFLLFKNWKKIKSKLNLKFILYSAVLLAIPWFYILLSPVGGARSAGVSVFHRQSGVVYKIQQDIAESKNEPLIFTKLMHNKAEGFARNIIFRYASHFDPTFLFFMGDPEVPRYKVPNIGQVYWALLPFLIIGIYQALKLKKDLLIAWFLIAPVASSLTFQTPSAVRAIYMVIPLSIIIGLGILASYQFFQHIVLKKAFTVILSLGILYSSVYYYDAYFAHMGIRTPYYWQDGYQELVKKVGVLQDKYDRIEITNEKGTPYIYFLFYQKYDPEKWQAQANQARGEYNEFHFMEIKSLDKILFVDKKCSAKDKIEDGVLYVCTNEEIPENANIIDKIYYNDGEPVFILLEK